MAWDFAETRNFLDTSSNEDHFSDAPEGPDAAAEGDTNSKRLPTSPLVLVGETDERGVPGTEVFEKRTADGSPDMTLIQPSPNLPVAIPRAFGGDSEGEEQEKEEVETPRSEIPITIVERVDSTPAHGEVPGTEAFEKRLADAAPDVIRTATSSPIPVTVVSVVDSGKPLHGEVLGTEAHKMRTADAQPDVVVRWNEEEDKIARKVRSERERIEKLVMDPGRARSVSPGQGPKDVAPVVRGRMGSLSTITLPIGEAKRKKEKEKGANGVEKEDQVDGIAKEQPSGSRSSSIPSQRCGSPMLAEGPEIIVDAPIETKAEEAKEETKEASAENPEVEEVREAAGGQVMNNFSAGDTGNVEKKRAENEVAEEDEEATTKEDPIKEEEEGDDDGGFGDDDFDDFGEVVEGEDFDDFGGFGEAEAFEPSPPPPPQIPVIPVPVLDFEKLDNEDAVRRAAAEAMATMFPIDKAKYQNVTPISIDDNVFLTERRFDYRFL